MNRQLTFFGALVMSVQCMFLHPTPVPILFRHYPEPNYSFAYDVNDGHTGDIKSQQESRRGDIVIGQYSLVQPDGIKRTVDYTANDNTGFLATINNQGKPMEQESQSPRESNMQYAQEETRSTNKPQEIQHNTASTTSYSTQGWPENVSSVTPIPITIIRSSVIHPSYSNGHPWN